MSSYYRRRSYRYNNWRTRSYKPPVYSVLRNLFGDAVYDIRKAFFMLDEEALDDLLEDYGASYGQPAEKYARQTFPSWKSGRTNLSGQTMERLVELVPPYLSAEARYDLLKKVLKRHKKSGYSMCIRINTKEPNEGLTQLNFALKSMEEKEALAFVPEDVMKAANWLYDDDITVARAMIAEAQRLESELIKENATREIELFRRTILSGQIKSASYTVEMPAGIISVVAYEPSKCFVSTVCFGGQARETKILRHWRDGYLLKSQRGRKFIVWYYSHGEELSKFISKKSFLLFCVRCGLKIFIKALVKQGDVVNGCQKRKR